MFSGVSAFDKHQAFTPDGGLTCLDPASRHLVLRDSYGVMEWGWPERGNDWVGAKRGDAPGARRGRA